MNFKKRGWKAYKKSRHLIIYTEKIDKAWKEIEISATIDVGTFVPCFRNEEGWVEYPDWARNRDRMIERVVKKFPLKK